MQFPYLADMIVKGSKRGSITNVAYEAMKTTAMNPNYDCFAGVSYDGICAFR